MMQTTPTFWNGIARKYATRPVSDVPAYEKTLERVQSHLKTTDHVLEVGGGTGSTALRLAPLVGQYLGTDYAPEMVAIANEKLADAPQGNLEFRTAGLGRGDFADESFDAVLGFNLFHLIPDAAASIREVHGMLKPGGLFISKTPCLRSKYFLYPVIKAMQLVGKAPFLRYYSEAALESDIRAAGFEIIETGNFPSISRFVVARKV